MGLCMGWLGLAMYAKALGGGGVGWTVHPLVSHAPLPAIALYVFAYSAGVGPLQWVWLGELVPPEYKFFSGLIYAQGGGSQRSDKLSKTRQTVVFTGYFQVRKIETLALALVLFDLKACAGGFNMI
jgi:hypothetical protein